MYDRLVNLISFRAAAVAVALMFGCSDDGGAVDAGRDAPARLALTVDGPVATASTRTVKVTIVSNGSTRSDTFPVGGLPATVDVPAPIQLTDWAITVDGIDNGGTIVGRGTKTVPSGTSETTVTLAAI